MNTGNEQFVWLVIAIITVLIGLVIFLSGYKEDPE